MCSLLLAAAAAAAAIAARTHAVAAAFAASTRGFRYSYRFAVISSVGIMSDLVDASLRRLAPRRRAAQTPVRIRFVAIFNAESDAPRTGWDHRTGGEACWGEMDEISSLLLLGHGMLWTRYEGSMQLARSSIHTRRLSFVDSLSEAGITITAWADENVLRKSMRT